MKEVDANDEHSNIGSN